MNPYDAIVEQLEGAREHGLESVKDRLGGILENLEQVSTSIREVMSVSADEVFPLEDIPSAMAGLREAAEAAEAAAAVPPPTVTLELLRNLDGARTQSDLLHGLLTAMTEHAARAVVLVFRPDGIGAWSAIGFDDVSQLEQWSCDRGESSLLDGFVDDPVPQRVTPADDPVMQRWLEGETTPDEALLVPISLRGKTMGAVYADRLEGAPWDPDSVQILVAISCWMIDTLKYRSASSSPMLAEFDGAATAVEEVEHEVVDEEVVEEAVVEDEVEEEEEEEEAEGEEEEAISEDEDASGAEADEDTDDRDEVEVVEDEPAEDQAPEAEETTLGDMASEPDFDPSATVQVDQVEAAAEVVEEPEAPEDEPESAVDEGDVEVSVDEVEFPEEVSDEGPDADEVVDTESIGDAQTDEEPAGRPMPPPVQPVVPPSDMAGPRAVTEDPPVAEVDSAPLSPEDESQHEEARRFARLLVSEIKLYNEDAVDRGREQNDLYARLKDDIDRSREMYERRIPAEIRTARDYFHEELVRILGNGDADTLGM